MHIIHEGEILVKEKYGSSPKQRLYVKPAGKHEVTKIISFFKVSKLLGTKNNITIILKCFGTDQAHIVILDEGRSNNLKSFLAEVFLPQGYPDSVSKDYMPYQIWDTAQAFCSTITGKSLPLNLKLAGTLHEKHGEVGTS